MIRMKTKPNLSGFSGTSRIKDMPVKAEAYMLPIVMYSCSPLFNIFHKTNTSYAGCVRYMHRLVPSVYFGIGKSQVDNPVVRPVVIYMVYLIGWKAPVHKQPCKSMGFVGDKIYHDDMVAKLVNMASEIAFFRPPTYRFIPSEYPGIRVVVKDFFELCLRKGTMILRHIRSFLASMFRGLDAPTSSTPYLITIGE